MIELRRVEFAHPGAEGFRLRVEELSLEQGADACLLGPSGSGKTTLLHLVAGLLVPAAGTVTAAGAVVSRMDDNARRAYRRQHVGLVFQNLRLVDYLTVEENVLLGRRLDTGRPDAAARARARALMEEAGIVALARRHPESLSQGERQRVAICRALAGAPRVLLADEPTGNLDLANKQRATAMMRRMAADCGATMLMVTHDVELAAAFSRQLHMDSVAAR